MTACLVLCGALLLTSASRATPFPAVDYSKLRISLQRSACYGDCPDYRVAISGDGSVVFTTDHRAVPGSAEAHRQFSRSPGVLVPGTHRTRIDPAAVRQLVERFRDARFFDLRDEYSYGATDAATYVVSIDTGRGSKQIVDYIGREAGMPAMVTEIEQAIDEAAGTKRWIEGTPEVIPLLEAEGADFRGELGLGLMAKAADRNDVVTMERLHALGAPISGGAWAAPLRLAAYGNHMDALSWLLGHGARDDRKMLVEALEAAAAGDADQAFDLLRKETGPASITPTLATKLLRTAAANGNVRIVSYLLQFHPRLNGSADDRPADDPPLWKAASGSCPTEGSHPNCDHRKVVRILLDAGADARWFHPLYRSSVLFLVDDPEIARMLPASGADPNFKDSEGEPIMFSISDEDVALLMLDAGGDLTAVRPAD